MPNLEKIQQSHTTATINYMKTEELALFYKIIEQCHKAKTSADIAKLVNTSLRQLIPHSMTAYGIGELASKKIYDQVNIGFPDGYIQEVVDKHNLLASPVAKQWSETQSPVLISKNEVPKKYPLAWQQAFRKHNINNLIAHGLVDITGKQTSYFSFADFKQEPGERELHIIDLVVPHLHVAISRSLDSSRNSTQNSANKSIISKRELEILTWVYDGKTNIEIGELLCISGFTVKNHIKNILEKLGAANRTHAVAKAVSIGIIEVN